MMMNFSESGHPIFRASSAFQRRELRSKGGGMNNVCGENIELLLRTDATNYPKTLGFGET